MARTLTIGNLDDGVVQLLRIRAARHGRSMEAEVRSILAAAVAVEPAEDFRVLAAKLREVAAGRPHTPSEQLVREGRDER